MLFCSTRVPPRGSSIAVTMCESAPPGCPWQGRWRRRFCQWSKSGVLAGTPCAAWRWPPGTPPPSERRWSWMTLPSSWSTRWVTCLTPLCHPSCPASSRGLESQDVRVWKNLRSLPVQAAWPVVRGLIWYEGEALVPEQKPAGSLSTLGFSWRASTVRFCGVFLGSLLNFVMILLLFYVLGFFGPRGMWDLAPWPGIKPTPLALAGEVLTIGLPRKSPKFKILSTYIINKNGWEK